MTSSTLAPSQHPLAAYIERLEAGGNLLPDSVDNTLEVVGILKSYGVVLDAYSNNLIYMAQEQFLVLFPFFKYFNGDVSFPKLLQHWWHDRINYEYAEYVMRVMLWHGGGELDTYLDTAEFRQDAEVAIAAKLQGNPPMQLLHKLFPDFLPEQIRQMVYTSELGQFWRIMSDLFIDLSDRYDRREITTIPEVVEHILAGLVAAASTPISYTVDIKGKPYDILPPAKGFTFLMDTAVPYVDTIFFRGTPFLGTISYNAQAQQIPGNQAEFGYGALYADPLPTGGAGIPPTLLMHDMRHFVPDYLHDFYQRSRRQEDDLLVKICVSFQKSMYCVTTAAIKGLAPHPIGTTEPEEQAANRAYFEAWMDRFLTSRLVNVNQS
ncbi:CO2 hydration protein [Roseofilum casamattae]|uniref:CO2 hydration protein n=1 Tax=Roseofilum casamattae BLCC-M143 TaxID=3022442 RepID=A0ABT7BT35_9CYAN|nr:CO2 hydration protein [Roseofilum casamattae]MDJ1181699.1 CO2 hydration protein [Roseofilum casamattae BLCC-M143]